MISISNIQNIFSGSYKSKNKEIERIRTELKDFSHIPSFKDDRKTLKNDFDTFLGDLKKANHRMKEKLKNGKTN